MYRKSSKNIYVNVKTFLKFQSAERKKQSSHKIPAEKRTGWTPCINMSVIRYISNLDMRQELILTTRRITLHVFVLLLGDVIESACTMGAKISISIHLSGRFCNLVADTHINGD